MSGDTAYPMDRIEISGVTATGYHGVFEHEKRDGQPFVVDVVLTVDLRRAGRSDALVDTINYGEVAADVVRRIEGEPFDLIERLAEVIAGDALARPLVQAVEVAVHKPQAPVGVPFGDVVVRMTRRRPVPVVIALGANLGDPLRTLAAAVGDLRGIPGLTIVTNSVPAAQALADTASTSGHQVVLTGGTRTPSEALVGPIAVQSLRGLHVDLVFLGCHGLDLKAGLTTPNLVEAETNRALIESGRSLCVVADHTKWEIVGLGTIIGLEGVATLVTDSGLAATARESLGEVVRFRQGWQTVMCHRPVAGRQARQVEDEIMSFFYIRYCACD